MKIFDTIVVGGGPCGVAAAVQLKRFGLDVAVFEKNKIGGLLLNAKFVENYPGFPEGISGIELVKLLKCHLKNLAIPVINENVQKVSFDGSFLIESNSKSRAKSLIVATGTEPRRDESCCVSPAFEDRVFYDVWRLDNISDSTIAVIGGGDAAFDYALRLAQKNKVFLLNKSDRIKSLGLLVERVLLDENINYVKNFRVSSISSFKSGLLLESDKSSLVADYTVFAIGREPSTGIEFFGLTPESESLFTFAGDYKNGIFRQTSIAVGDGVKSAMKIYYALTGEKL